ncbi:MAG: hypothetical protein IM650_12190, partial [Phenylobacterium sp.]
KIGGEYRLSEIGIRHWVKFADENGIDFDHVRSRTASMADQLPDLAKTVRDEIAKAGAAHPLLDKLTTVFVDRSAWVKTQLEKAQQPG